MDIDEAEEELLQAGFKVTISIVNSDEDEDTVVTTDPEAGQRANQGSTIDVEVSSGMPPETILPDLIGRTREVARATLSALRIDTEIEFTWEFINVDITDPGLRNTIISTNPGPGATITEDTVIIIRINRLITEGG